MILSLIDCQKGVALSENLTIILEDKNQLALCGANDINLKILEDILEIKLFSKGNELHVEASNDLQRKLFAEVLEIIKKYQAEGRYIDADVISSIVDSLKNDNKNDQDLLNSKTLVLPNGAKVYPHSSRQASYLDCIEKNEIIFGIGPAGTGKTYLAVAAALSEVLRKKKRKLVITRPVVEAGESLGFLPGDLAQKLNPYLKPIYDAMECFLNFETIEKMEENHLIEIAPLAYMRGRSLSDSFIILDEAQNTTKTQMKMFLTRIGKGSKAVITGDITQIDLPDKNGSGLIHAQNILKFLLAIFSISSLGSFVL